MREINCADITDAVKRTYIKAGSFLPPDIAIQLECVWETEESEMGREALLDLVSSFNAASSGVPICEDSGVAIIFLNIGQDVHITGGDFEDAIKVGVRQGYDSFRKSADSISKENIENILPVVIHTRLVSGDKISIKVMPTELGSANMSAIKMFKPSVKPQEIEDFIVGTISNASDRSSAPWIIGVGLGGTLDKCTLLAVQALYRPIDVRNPFYVDMERRVLDKINRLGIGPRGLGGSTSALAVNIEAFETHMEGMPCVVNIGNYATRRATVEL